MILEQMDNAYKYYYYYLFTNHIFQLITQTKFMQYLENWYWNPIAYFSKIIIWKDPSFMCYMYQIRKALLLRYIL